MSANPRPAPDSARLIAAQEWKQQRWGWLESVRRDASLSMTARLVAHSLALDYVIVRTLQCDPTYDELATDLGVSKDTVKRAIRDLIAARWITRDGGIGRGNNSSYGFLTRAEIISIKGGKYAPRKEGKTAPLSKSQKGANLPGKGGKNARRHIIEDNNPWNHGARAHARDQAHAHARQGKVSDNPMVDHSARTAVDRWRQGGSDAGLRDLQPWVINHILGAGLLTDDEIARVWPELGNEKGESDDGQ